MDNVIKLNESIAELMFDADNMTSKQLAERIGVTDRTVNRWRSGEVQIAYSNLIKIADVFKCSLDFLVGRSDMKIEFEPCETLPFYERLRAVMNENHVTRYELVHKTDIKENYLYQWKKGSEPQVPALIEIADYLNVTIDYLVGRER